MNVYRPQNQYLFNVLTALLRTTGVSLLSMFALIAARGQVVIGAASLPPNTPKIRAPLQPDPALGSLSSLASAFATQTPPFQRGLLAVRPHMSYVIRYGNSILRVPGEPENTWIQTLSPGVMLTLGDRWIFDYTIAKNTYSARLIEDTIDHNLRLSGLFSAGDWSFGITQSYGSNSPTLVETGGQTRERSLSTSITAIYELGSRTALDVSASRGQRDADPLNRSVNWTGSDWVQWSGTLSLRYKLSHRLTAATGMTIGYDEVSANPDMSHSQPHLQITWDATDKFSFAAKAGIESRKSSANSAKLRNGIYSASVHYSPLQTTTVSIFASEITGSSYFSDQTTNNTAWGISLQQRLALRYFVSAGFNHGRTTYVDTRTLSAAGRNDKYQSLNFGISTRILQRGAISITYEYSENLSNSPLFGFDSSTYTLETSYSF